MADILGRNKKLINRVTEISQGIQQRERIGLSREGVDPSSPVIRDVAHIATAEAYYRGIPQKPEATPDTPESEFKPAA